MASQLGSHVFPAMKEDILHSQDPEVIWHEHKTIGIDTFKGFVQLYSDKSSTTLKSSSFTSYPLHITRLNFSDSFRRHCISRNYTVVGYIPTSFNNTSSPPDDVSIDINPFSYSMDRKVHMELVKNSLRSILNPLCSARLKGFPFRNADGVIRQCHPIMAHYRADIPGSKGHPCHYPWHKTNEALPQMPRPPLRPQPLHSHPHSPNNLALVPTDADENVLPLIRISGAFSHAREKMPVGGGAMGRRRRRGGDEMGGRATGAGFSGFVNTSMQRSHARGMMGIGAER
eukprot:gb/GEZJ01001816.1/.p1 GENE.gb/GEZJ01001816.1/~~gb/GEZJ01001816.1/.p1  ORF type:complete len:286 (+),score=22.95 gb/GEZJ01001816.1/:1476-2333(+)